VRLSVSLRAALLRSLFETTTDIAIRIAGALAPACNALARSGSRLADACLFQDTKMTDENNSKSESSIDAALPLMKERARDQIHLMFLVDDFQRANTLNMAVVEATTSRFSGSL